MDLVIIVKEINGNCPTYNVGDSFTLKAGYQLVSDIPLCMHGLSSLMLGVKERTYDGEPAIRLEKLLSASRSPRIELFETEVPDYSVSVIERWKVLLEEIRRLSDVDIEPGLVKDPFAI